MFETLSDLLRSVDLHTLGEAEATQTAQQRQAADLIDAAKEVFAFSGQSLRNLSGTPCRTVGMLMLPVSTDKSACALVTGICVAC